MSARQRVRDWVLGAVESGELPPGGKLPTERDLAERLGVSRTTLRLVLVELTAHGLVSPRQGSG